MALKTDYFDGNLKLILPIVPTNTDELFSQAKAACDYHPDMIEWRADWFDDIAKKPVYEKAIKDLREIAGEIPILCTLRDYEENGHQPIGQAEKRNAIEDMVRSGLIDVVDIELSHGKEYIHQLTDLAHQYDVKVLVAYHAKETPDENGILSIMRQEYDFGADILKFAFTPQSYADVVRLSKVVLEAKKDWLDRPVLSISSGEKGMISRIAGKALGTDMTFASIGKTMQVHISDLRDLEKIIQRYYSSN